MVDPSGRRRATSTHCSSDHLWTELMLFDAYTYTTSAREIHVLVQPDQSNCKMRNCTLDRTVAHEMKGTVMDRAINRREHVSFSGLKARGPERNMFTHSAAVLAHISWSSAHQYSTFCLLFRYPGTCSTAPKCSRPCVHLPAHLYLCSSAAVRVHVDTTAARNQQDWTNTAVLVLNYALPPTRLPLGLPRCCPCWPEGHAFVKQWRTAAPAVH